MPEELNRLLTEQLADGGLALADVGVGQLAFDLFTGAVGHGSVSFGKPGRDLLPAHGQPGGIDPLAAAPRGVQRNDVNI